MASPTGTTYTVIPLWDTSANALSASINRKGQVAFNVEGPRGQTSRAKFYDGRTVRDIGTLGFPNVTAKDLNDRGQITGRATVNADGTYHGFRWSLSTGMVDLTPGSPHSSVGNAINNYGQVAGSADLHAFLWTPGAAPLDIGTFGPSSASFAEAINDAGMVAGEGDVPPGGSFRVAVFRWSKTGGFHGIGTQPSEFTYATDINAAGHIVGETPFPPGGNPHAFLWTQTGGLRDLGTGSGNRSTAFDINDHDVVVGVTETMYVGPSNGFVWTRATGLVELRSQSPDLGASAFAVNNLNQVVGGIDNHAYVYTQAQGVVDLNTRIPGAPAGLTLLEATAISDNGSIVAQANTGLVLLVPRCGCSKVAPTVGAITLTGTARTGVALSVSAAFKDVDLGDTHKASWSWGDGSTDQGTVSEKQGTGSVSGQHVYRAPGIYTITLTVTDSGGLSTTVQSKITVCGAGAYVAGQGWFISSQGASSVAGNQPGIATFAVLSGAGNNGAAGSQGKASIEFDTAGIHLRSEQVDVQSIQGGSVQFSGRGSVNGAGGYNFLLTGKPAGTSGSGTDRVRVRIWHYAPGSQAEVVDYDNQPASSAAGIDREGTAVGEGAITIQSN